MIGRGGGEADIAVLRVDTRLTPPGLPVVSSLGLRTWGRTSSLWATVRHINKATAKLNLERIAETPEWRGTGGP